MSTRDRGPGGPNRAGGHRRKSGRPGKPARSSRPIVRRGTVRLPADVAQQVRLGHPWVYRDALGARPLREASGAPLELVDSDGEFVGRGIFDSASPVAIRVMTRLRDERIGPDLIGQRVEAAIALRRRLLDWDTLDAMRLINADADGLPGIAVERYGDYLMVQLYSEAIMGFRQALFDKLEEALSPAGIYEQRRFRPLSGQAPKGGAELVRGKAAPVELEVREGDLKFWVDVSAPLATGLFADLREGRRAIGRWAKGRRVLNLFSYTGAITLYAAQGGASEVTAVDVAAKAHARARRNFALNGFAPETPEHIVGDTFKVLARFREHKRQFDMVVLDPPAFASASRGGRPWSAQRDYAELVAAALDVLAPGGLLAAASSTRKLSLEDFEASLAEGATRAHTSLRIVERCSLPPDFPTLPVFSEGNYLKFLIAIRD